jgi:hypothetical protein
MSHSLTGDVTIQQKSDGASSLNTWEELLVHKKSIPLIYIPTELKKTYFKMNHNRSKIICIFQNKQ